MIKPRTGGHLGMWSWDMKHKWFEWSKDWFQSMENKGDKDLYL